MTVDNAHRVLPSDPCDAVLSLSSPDQITKFLNEFDVSLRYKLSTLAERLTTLERHLEWCETSLKHKMDPQRPNTKPSAPASAPEVLPPPDRI